MTVTPPSPHVSKPFDNSCGLQKNPNLLTTAYHTPVLPQGSLSTFYTLSHSMFQKYQNARNSLNKSLLYICTNSDKLHGVCLLKKNHRTPNDYAYKSTVYERERIRYKTSQPKAVSQQEDRRDQVWAPLFSLCEGCGQKYTLSDQEPPKCARNTLESVSPK